MKLHKAKTNLKEDFYMPQEEKSNFDKKQNRYSNLDEFDSQNFEMYFKEKVQMERDNINKRKEVNEMMIPTKENAEIIKKNPKMEQSIIDLNNNKPYDLSISSFIVEKDAQEKIVQFDFINDVILK